MVWEHPNFSMSGGGTTRFAIRNDVALLKLNDSFNSDDFPPGVGTVCLPTRRVPNESKVTVLGWGDVSPVSPGHQSRVLKEVCRLRAAHAIKTSR